MPHKLDKERLKEQILGYLAAHPDGLTGPDLREQLQPRVSQPTLSRLLTDLRSRGRVSVTGRARATRYHLAGGRRALQELRSRLLHQRVAIRLVREPELLDQARRRLEHLRVVNPAGRAYHDRWEHLLNEDLAELLRIMSSAGPELDLLRKESPLTVLVRPEDRADLFRRTGLDEPPAA